MRGARRSGRGVRALWEGSVMTALIALWRKAFHLLFAALFALTGMVSSAPSDGQAGLTLLREYDYLYSDGVAFCQGLATDGESFYGTGCVKYVDYNAIVKIDASTGAIVCCNDFCLPPEVMAKGYSHLGDCAYADGKIYAACEAFFFRDPAVMVFDAETLDFLEYHVLPREGQGSGHFPWLCVQDGTIYYTQSRDVDEVRLLDAADFSYKGSVHMDRTVTKITGGDVLDGVLYLASNVGGREKITYSVDLATGETKEAFVRDTGNAGTEAEGLCVSCTDGEIRFHYLDVVPLARTTVRTYASAA